MKNSLTSALTALALGIVATGCAMFSGSKPAPVPWSRALVASAPSGSMMCYAYSYRGTEYDKCYESLDTCSFHQNRTASESGVTSISACSRAENPYCFVYDTKGEKALRCSSTASGCERALEGAKDEIAFPAPTNSSCGPLNEGSAASSK